MKAMSLNLQPAASPPPDLARLVQELDEAGLRRLAAIVEVAVEGQADRKREPIEDNDLTSYWVGC